MKLSLSKQHFIRELQLTYRFLQGPDTDQGTVSKIRDAITEQKEITVQLINYTKSGKLVSILPDFCMIFLDYLCCSLVH